MDKVTAKNNSHWRSIESLTQDAEFMKRLENEFPATASEMTPLDEVGRRKFLGIMGASFALTGMTSACIRKPVEYLVPYSKLPEHLIPGKPQYYATSAQIGGSVLGLIAKSFDGRPIKIEGNTLHPNSLGSTNAWAQAEVLNVFDPDRSQHPTLNGEKTSWPSAFEQLKNVWSQWSARGGEGAAIIVPYRASPSLARRVADLRSRLPKLKIFNHDPLFPKNAVDASVLMGLEPSLPVYQLERSKVTFALDADFLGTEGDTVKNTRQFANSRRVEKETDSMSRLYASDAHFSVTSLNADHRLRLPSYLQGELLKAVAFGLQQSGVNISLPANISVSSMIEIHAPWIQALVGDLMNNRGASLVIVGDRQPAWVHVLGYSINQALGNFDSTIELRKTVGVTLGESLDSFVKEIQSGNIKHAMVLGVNLALTAPSSLGISAALERLEMLIQHSYYQDETTSYAKLHIPSSHFLESWCDNVTRDGVVSLQQPLIAPLFDSVSELELLLRFSQEEELSSYEYLKKFWKPQIPSLDFEATFKKALHDGILQTVFNISRLNSVNLQAVHTQLTTPATPSSGIEINVYTDSKVFDGRYVNNAWLQELPDPVSKIVWDNAALISPKTAKELNIKSGDVIELTNAGVTVSAAAFVSPGAADQSIGITLGYGRTIKGRVSEGTGFNAYPFIQSEGSFFATDSTIRKTAAFYEIGTTQEYGTMADRPIIREATLAEYQKDPKFVDRSELLDPKKHKNFLWDQPNVKSGQQWGMSIDLNTCTSCNACTIACQSENNIPVVGKQRVIDKRDMHWIRLDRYFTGSIDDPQVLVQPVACMHCENAPCESVCPVAATVHGPEGTNDMAYNRCIGTRYCANNCPYKVRKFNFFNYAKENHAQNDLAAMQQNPHVTIRFRGVMEKCSYCIQRVNEAKIEAKVAGRDQVADGRIQTACQQVCPSKAIVFGDINDPNSLVSKARAQNRDYALLGELNTKPRTTYLAKLRNPNPNLV